MSRRIPLTKLEPGTKAKVVEIQAGLGLIRRLEALGIMIGHSIEAVSGSFIRGPVTVKAGRIRTAIGYGAARKVIVETEGKES